MVRHGRTNAGAGAARAGEAHFTESIGLLDRAERRMVRPRLRYKRSRSWNGTDRLRTVQRPDHHDAAEKRSRFEHRMGRVMVRLGSGIVARSETHLATAQLRLRWNRPAQQGVDEQPQQARWWRAVRPQNQDQISKDAIAKPSTPDGWSTPCALAVARVSWMTRLGSRYAIGCGRAISSSPREISKGLVPSRPDRQAPIRQGRRPARI
jgi:hypothetical protein